MVTAVLMPDGVDGQKVYGTLRDLHGVVLAGGQGPLRGRIIRIGHMGYMNGFDMVTALAALELALADYGFHPPDAGSRRGTGARRAWPAGDRRCLTRSWSRRRSPTPAWSCSGGASTSTSTSRCRPRSWPSGSASTTR